MASINKHPLRLVSCRPRLRRWIVAALLPLLLFAQFATAAYRCPQLSQTLSPSASMPMNCDPANADPDQPTLCKAHCEAHSQANGSTPDFSPALLAFGPHPVWRPVVHDVAAPLIATPNAPPRGSPPLYLLHMVLRN
jgi:hypothetical protein